MSYQEAFRRAFIGELGAISVIHYGALGTLRIQKLQWDAGWLHYNLIVVFDRATPETFERVGAVVRRLEKDLNARINVRIFSGHEIEDAVNCQFLFQGTDSPAIFESFGDAELLGGVDLRAKLIQCGRMCPELVAFRVMMLKFKFEKLLGSKDPVGYRLVEMLKRLMSSVQGVVCLDVGFQTDMNEIRKQYGRIAGSERGATFNRLMDILEQYDHAREQEYASIAGEAYGLMRENARIARDRYLAAGRAA
jgi:hypothetical protein